MGERVRTRLSAEIDNLFASLAFPPFVEFRTDSVFPDTRNSGFLKADLCLRVFFERQRTDDSQSGRMQKPALTLYIDLVPTMACVGDVQLKMQIVNGCGALGQRDYYIALTLDSWK